MNIYRTIMPTPDQLPGAIAAAFFKKHLEANGIRTGHVSATNIEGLLGCRVFVVECDYDLPKVMPIFHKCSAPLPNNGAK